MLESVFERWEEKRNKQIFSRLDRAPDAKVLDLGCGDGEFTLEVGRRVGTRRLYGIDTQKESLEAARARGVSTLEMDLNEPLDLPDDSFDVVVSNQVIEHLWHPIQFLDEIERVLRDDGYAVLSTENLSSWDNVAALVLGGTPFSMEFDQYAKLGNYISPQNRASGTKYPPHTRIFSYRGLVAAFDVACLDVTAIDGSGYLPFNFFSDIDPAHARFLTVRATPSANEHGDDTSYRRSSARSRPQAESKTRQRVVE